MVKENWQQYGFKSASDSLSFSRSKLGKEIQQHQIEAFIQQESMKLEAIRHFNEQEAMKNAFLAAFILHEEEKKHQRHWQHLSETVVKLVPMPEPARTTSNSHDTSSHYLNELDKIHREIINTDQKYQQYDKACDKAMSETVDIDKLPKEEAINALEKRIKALEAEQLLIQGGLMAWDGADEEKLRVLVNRNNANEAQLGVFRTMLEVKQVKALMYDINGDSTDKFNEAHYTLPKGMKLAKTPDNSSFYLLNEKVDLAKMSEIEKNQAQKQFKKEEPSLINVKSFLSINKNLELEGLSKKQSTLVEKLNNQKSPNIAMTKALDTVIKPPSPGSDKKIDQTVSEKFNPKPEPKSKTKEDESGKLNRSK